MLAACAACAPLLSQETVGRIEPGLTTRQEILEEIGEPDAAEVDPRGGAHWTYVRQSPLRVSWSSRSWLLAPVIDLSDMIILYFPPSAKSERRVPREVLELSFGPDGILDDFSYARQMPPSLVGEDPE